MDLKFHFRVKTLVKML